MNRLTSNTRSLTGYFTEQLRHPGATTFFVKVIFIVALFRFTRLWIVADVFFHGLAPSFPRSFIGKVVLWPAMLAQENPSYFFLMSLGILVIGLLGRPNYLVNILFFWIVASFFKIRYPATNGADFVLLVVSGLMIPLATSPWPRGEYPKILCTTAYNTFRILIMIQVLTIYLISGWDKITSDLWRSGEAFEYIAHLDIMFNPVFTPLLEHQSAQVAMSWATILFELLFILLVWFQRTRLPILAVGFGFHIVIWLMLGLPDFAWTMIATYPIFLKDKDFATMRSAWQRLRGKHTSKR